MASARLLMILAGAMLAFAHPVFADRTDLMNRFPDKVHVITESGEADTAVSELATVSFHKSGEGLEVLLAAPNSEVKRLVLKWDVAVDPATLCLGDAWERSYSDLGWKSIKDAGAMPWYFAARSAAGTDGYGVMTGPAAMCCWKIDDSGITLLADVRCGGKGVQLGQRTLKACTIVTCHAATDQDPLDVLTKFCHQMCPHPRLPKMPIYGFNDWNSTYGHNTLDHFVRDATVLASLAPPGPDRPFMVVDDGWQANRQDGQTPDNHG